MRSLAREAIQAGRIAAVPAQEIWGGLGSSIDCPVCQKAVEPGEMGLELEFAADADSSVRTCHLHVRCYAAWDFARRRGSGVADGR